MAGTDSQPPGGHSGAAGAGATVFGLTGRSGESRHARLILSPDGILLEPQGMASRKIAFCEVTASLGGTEGDHLVLTVGNPQRDGLLIYLESRDAWNGIAALAPSPLRERLNQLEGQRHTQNRRTVVRWVCALVVVALAGWGVWRGVGALTDLAVARIPVQWEVELGRLAVRRVLAEKRLLRQSEVTQAIEVISSRLTNAATRQPYRFRIQVVNDPQVNAFALPGGEIVVLSGLITASKSPEEVAGVLAHEMQHVIGRHGLRQMVHSLGIAAAVQIALGGGGELIAVLRNQAPRLLSLQYSRTQETEADLRGLALLRAARIGPRGLLDFFTRLAAREGNLRMALGVASSHPSTRLRLSELRKAIRSNPGPEPVPFELDWDGVRKVCE